MHANFFPRLISRLTVGRKLALIYFLDLTAVFFISGILVYEKYIVIDFAKKEIVGNDYIAVIRDALVMIAASRDVPAADAAATRLALSDGLQAAESRFGDAMGSAQLSRDFVRALRESHGAARQILSTEDKQATEDFAIGRELLTRVGNRSNLILDPDLDSYYTMSLIVLRFPELLEILHETSELVLHMPSMQEHIHRYRQTQFLILEGRLAATMLGINKDCNEAFDAGSPALKAALGKSQRQMQQAIDRFRSASRVLVGLTPGTVSREDFIALNRSAVTTLGEAWSSAKIQLDRLLQKRIDDRFSLMWIHFGTTAVLLIAILSLVYFVAGQIAIPIRRLAGVAGNVRSTGSYALRASWDSHDEIGQLVRGFNGMLEQLDQQRMNHLKQMESRLDLWAKVFEASSESIVVMDAEWGIITANGAVCRSTGYDIHELVGQNPLFLFSERNDRELIETLRHASATKASWQGEMWIKRKDGESYPAWIVLNALCDPSGEITHYFGISLDISERKANELRIEFLAHHDVLTRLPNRFLCRERLDLSIRQAQRTGCKVAIMFVDLDRFKNINDSMGHHIGDALLCSVGQRLTNTVRDCDTVSRLGGDEFIVILGNVANAEKVGQFLEGRLMPALQQPHLVEGAELYVSSSIGVAIFPDDGEDIDELMRNADSAMYQAKNLGRNNFQFFTPALNDRVVEHLHLESELRHAVERGELVLYFQPRIKASDGRVAGVESLIRWKHPTKGMILPNVFIPVAEESGLIVSIGAWIIREACRQHLLWRDSGLGEIPVSINLSAVQLRGGGLIRTLERVLAENSIDAKHIELELTESILMENVEKTISILQEIKQLGFSLSIDDFGTGFSSLNYLYQFPIDKLKIDMSFVQNMHSAPRNLAVTKAIIGLGHTLDLGVVAEGVESALDASVLTFSGCDELQGYYFGRPMPADRFETWLAEYGMQDPEMAAVLVQ